jgi:hypothetical protein
MNSGELTVDVPLASVESDCEDSFESLRQQPSGQLVSFNHIFFVKRVPRQGLEQSIKTVLYLLILLYKLVIF